MRYSSIHTHTSFSDGVHSVEENILSAIAKNMVSIGFSDHCYTYFDTSYCIPRDKVSVYIDEVERLKKKYADKIEIYLGIELDGFARLEDREKYDYVIGDCHYVNTADGYKAVDLSRDDIIHTTESFFGGDFVRMAQSYYESYTECIRQMKPDVLGHIDLVTKYSLVDQTDRRYIAAAREALAASLKVCPIIEMNTGAMSRGYRTEPYPAIFLIDAIKEQGGRILLSSDSHNANDLTFYFDECVELLRSRGVLSMVQLVGRRFEEVGI